MPTLGNHFNKQFTESSDSPRLFENVDTALITAHSQHLTSVFKYKIKMTTVFTVKIPTHGTMLCVRQLTLSAVNQDVRAKKWNTFDK